MGDLTVAKVRSAKPGRYADGGGLYLLVKESGSRSWLLRIQADGRRRDIGLGAVDLASKRSALDDELPQHGAASGRQPPPQSPQRVAATITMTFGQARKPGEKGIERHCHP